MKVNANRFCAGTVTSPYVELVLSSSLGSKLNSGFANVAKLAEKTRMLEGAG